MKALSGGKNRKKYCIIPGTKYCSKNNSAQKCNFEKRRYDGIINGCYTGGHFSHTTNEKQTSISKVDLCGQVLIAGDPHAFFFFCCYLYDSGEPRQGHSENEGRTACRTFSKVLKIR